MGPKTKVALLTVKDAGYDCCAVPLTLQSASQTLACATMDKRIAPDQKTAARNEAARRKARQAEALRANLRRRKEQARGRAEEGEGSDETKPETQR
jgi:hypothetical protein